MTYYPDLSLFPVSDQNVSSKIFAVGWLNNQYEYPRGSVSETFLERLWTFCRYPAFVTRGFHHCEICLPVERNVKFLENRHILKAQREGVVVDLGCAEIDVFAENGIIYHAPNLVYHYVLDHEYHPPEPFVQAVLTCPLPTTEEYKRILENLGWGHVVDFARPQKQEVHIGRMQFTKQPCW